MAHKGYVIGTLDKKNPRKVWLTSTDDKWTDERLYAKRFSTLELTNDYAKDIREEYFVIEYSPIPCNGEKDLYLFYGRY